MAWVAVDIRGVHSALGSNGAEGIPMFEVDGLFEFAELLAGGAEGVSCVGVWRSEEIKRSDEKVVGEVDVVGDPYGEWAAVC